MRPINERQFIDCLLAAYNLGAAWMRQANSARGWRDTHAKRERAALNKILRSVGSEKLTDEEYLEFCG